MTLTPPLRAKECCEYTIVLLYYLYKYTVLVVLVISFERAVAVSRFKVTSLSSRSDPIIICCCILNMLL